MSSTLRIFKRHRTHITEKRLTNTLLISSVAVGWEISRVQFELGTTGPIEPGTS